MNLYSLLKERETAANPIKVGVVGAGKFATMFMSQVIRTPGMRLVAVCDLNTERAKQNLLTAGFESDQITYKSKDKRKVMLTDDPVNLFTRGVVDVIVESTGDAIAGVDNAIQSIENGIDVIMVNVEADVLAGPSLVAKAQENGVIYSLAYGDQPALICEQIDTIRAMGLSVVCAGKGTKYLPEYHQSTPSSVWDYYGLTKEDAQAGGMNSKMFNSFLDGTKSAIEMTAVANATGLKPPQDGLLFPPCSVDNIASTLIPHSEGGILEEKGMVEVISSLNRDGSDIERDLRWGVFVVFEAETQYVRRCFAEYGLVTDNSGNYSALYRPYHLIGLELGISVEVISSLNRDGSDIERDLRWGVFVVFEAETQYVRRCFAEYGLVTDNSGNYSALYRPYHLIGLELGISVASVVLRREPTGSPVSFSADVISIAKRDLGVGEMLDGEGGSMVWGKIVPVENSLLQFAVPIGFATGLELARPIAKGAVVTWHDVRVRDCHSAHSLRKQMEFNRLGYDHYVGQ